MLIHQNRTTCHVDLIIIGCLATSRQFKYQKLCQYITYIKNHKTFDFNG